ncbi:MAG TPA: hypothetical protein VFK57_10315 [Vicinamibacterales bacterium]|nr:hypothetical protein [Vicinamibacterales bacterium]
MRTWVKVTIGGGAVILLALAALGATGAYFVLRHMETRSGSEAQAIEAIDAVKARFGPRPPLVEITDPRRADIRINRPVEASTVPVNTIHVINWKSENGELVRTDVPLWLMRFSTVNIISQLGIAPAGFRLTVADVQRYGPGIVVDYASQGAFRLLIWVD